jgi:hypothetical protein
MSEHSIPWDRLIGWRVSPRDFEILKAACKRWDENGKFPLNFQGVMDSIEIHVDMLVEDGKPIPIWREELKPLYPTRFNLLNQPDMQPTPPKDNIEINPEDYEKN